MNYCFDLDNTLCFTNGNDYKSCRPNIERIKIVNGLYEQGHHILIFTARGMGTFKGNTAKVYDNLYSLTKSQLVEWNVNHHSLILGKPSYDLLVCDKAVNSEVWFDNKEYDTGFVAGAFDVIHPGYIEMFNFCNQKCRNLIIGLHADPSINGKKMKPILTVEERKRMLLSLKGVQDVIPYDTEEMLFDILTHKKINVRFLGDDYKDKSYTGDGLNIPVVFISREHNWSATKYKTLIHNQIFSNELHSNFQILI